MLYNTDFMKPGQTFPPTSEKQRLDDYKQFKQLFDLDHANVYEKYGLRVNNERWQFSNSGIALDMGFTENDYISFHTILSYQRLMSLKMADLVAGEHPVIRCSDEAKSKKLAHYRASADFDEKIFATTIDMSRYGDAVWRIFLNEETNEYDFCVWDPSQWFPIVNIDGTNRIVSHVIMWAENRGSINYPDWYGVVQNHFSGYYMEQQFHLDGDYPAMYFGRPAKGYKTPQRRTLGIKRNAIINLRSFMTSDTVYGHSDYDQVDSIIAELQNRLAQISRILDKHSDPSLAGPVSMLQVDPKTGQRTFKAGEFYAVADGSANPEYLTWDGQLEAAFQHVKTLLDQLYILSEMGRTLLGAGNEGFQATSGAALRTALINPLAKARRISNSLTLPVKYLFETLSKGTIKYDEITVSWADGLPNDPREQYELVKIATGKDNIMPLEIALVEHLGRTPDEAKQWAEAIAELEALGAAQLQNQSQKPGPPDDGTAPQNKGSEYGLNNFKSDKSKESAGSMKQNKKSTDVKRGDLNNGTLR